MQMQMKQKKESSYIDLLVVEKQVFKLCIIMIMMMFHSDAHFSFENRI